MTRLAQTERQALCDSLLAAGPDAPTLSGSWTAADLAAHLVIRESARVDLAALQLNQFSLWDLLSGGFHPSIDGPVRQQGLRPLDQQCRAVDRTHPPKDARGCRQDRVRWCSGSSEDQ